VNVPEPPFEELEHDADVALRVRGATLRELFINAAVGMTRVMGGELPPASESREISIDAPDVETLLVDWLGELALLAGDDGLLFSEFDVHEIEPTRLRTTIRGGAASYIEVHVKAVTYHNLEVLRTETGFETVIVFDV
jgi:SHS2 domain-containing protein